MPRFYMLGSYNSLYKILENVLQNIETCQRNEGEAHMWVPYKIIPLKLNPKNFKHSKYIFLFNRK